MRMLSNCVEGLKGSCCYWEQYLWNGFRLTLNKIHVGGGITCHLPLAGPYDPAPTSSLLSDDINEHHMDEFKLVKTALPSSSPTVVAFDTVNSTDYVSIPSILHRY